MSSKETLIEPMIYHGPGGCPICSGPIYVADSEISVMRLNPDGTPTEEETNVRCVGICSHCGHRLRMVRWGGIYIPYGEAALIIRNGELRAEAKKRVERLNKEGKEKNPFDIFNSKE